jgi:8-oxo-dGTP pyrophosphatase MutT (NUDIX family)
MKKKLQPKVVTRAIILVDGKVLLGKRARGMGTNQYALVGGKPEPGETLEETVVREVHEEIGVLFKNIKLWKTELDTTSVSKAEPWNVYYFYGDMEGSLNLKPDEISDVIYVGKDGLSDVDFAFDHKDILVQFFKDFS